MERNTEVSKNIFPIPFQRVIWLHGEAWKSTKATQKSLTNEISKTEYKLWQALRGKISLQIIQKMVNVVKSNKRIMCHVKFIGKGKPMANLVSLVDHKVLGNTVRKFRQLLWLQAKFLYLSSLLILERDLSWTCFLLVVYMGNEISKRGVTDQTSSLERSSTFRR